MQNKMIFEQTISQNLQIHASQILSLKILSMDLTELDHFLNEEYLENPLLEKHPDSYSEPPLPVTWGTDTKQQSDFTDIPYVEEKYQILDQLNPAQFTRDEYGLMLALTDCLDQDGFLPLSVKEASLLLKKPEAMVRSCLTVLQNLEPVGIFAPDLPHCLLLQLKQLGVCTDMYQEIILNHLEDIAAGQIGAISRATGYSTAEIRKCIAVIRELNPHPLTAYSSDTFSYIVPDILFVPDDTGLNITLNDNWSGRYEINDYYEKMMHETSDPEMYNYFSKNLERARLILRSIEQRRSTILSVSNAILKFQTDFFVYGNALNPMTLSDIAAEIDMHVSTVSRAIKGKYIQYPGGLVLIRDLFTSGIKNQPEGNACSSDTIKKHIQEFIRTEDSMHPLSDSKLAAKLSELNISVSRRTIAKYRDALSIGSTAERRKRN